MTIERDDYAEPPIFDQNDLVEKKEKKSKQKPKTRPTQSRNWCFTDFELLDFKKTYNEYKDIIRYITFGKEICPKTKKTHFQGWVQFFNKKRLNGVKRILGSKKIHVESCYGNEYSNDKYCQKDGKFCAYGKFITQGHRTDLEIIKKKIDDGASILECAQENFQIYLQYGRGIKEYKNMIDKVKRKKFREVKTIVLSGETGSGKTRRAMESTDSIYKITGTSLDWWDGYEGEETILIDEYNNDVPITQMLNLLDGYELRLPVKGSFTYANWKKVFITTNLTRDELHPNAKPEHRRALNRRISDWISCRNTPEGNTISSGVLRQNG